MISFGVSVTLRLWSGLELVVTMLVARVKYCVFGESALQPIARWLAIVWYIVAIGRSRGYCTALK